MASTNEFALELSRQNMAGNGSVIIAEFQTKGRGQLGRSWFSEPFANLMFSIVLKDVTKEASDAFLINKAIAVALQQSIQTLLPEQKVRIKWPNDIYINERKVCGILVENSYNGSNISQSIVGIGINVNQHFESFSSLNAISISEHLGAETDREELLKKILENIESKLTLTDKSPDKINQAFDKHLLGYGELCVFDLDGSIEGGTLRGCDSSGRLILEMNGKEQHFVHGQIRQLIG